MLLSLKIYFGYRASGYERLIVDGSGSLNKFGPGVVFLSFENKGL